MTQNCFQANKHSLMLFLTCSARAIVETGHRRHTDGNKARWGTAMDQWQEVKTYTDQASITRTGYSDCPCISLTCVIRSWNPYVTTKSKEKDYFGMLCRIIVRNKAQNYQSDSTHGNSACCSLTVPGNICGTSSSIQRACMLHLCC